jgi:hypothetical protein
MKLDFPKSFSTQLTHNILRNFSKKFSPTWRSFNKFTLLVTSSKTQLIRSIIIPRWRTAHYFWSKYFENEARYEKGLDSSSFRGLDSSLAGKGCAWSRVCLPRSWFRVRTRFGLFSVVFSAKFLLHYCHEAENLHQLGIIKKMLTFRGVQFVYCISKLSHIFQYFGVFRFLKTQKTLHSYWISDLSHIPSNIYHIEVLASPFLSYFLHIPDILFSVLPLNLLACTSSREPRGYCAICGLCARFAVM